MGWRRYGGRRHGEGWGRLTGKLEDVESYIEEGVVDEGHGIVEKEPTKQPVKRKPFFGSFIIVWPSVS